MPLLRDERLFVIEANATDPIRAYLYRFQINKTWLGEYPALFRGKHEEVEDPLDRAVVMAVRLASRSIPNLPPPPVPRSTFVPQVPLRAALSH